MTIEQRKRVSVARRGIPAWNKGIHRIAFITKQCHACQTVYSRPQDIGDRAWLSRRFCSKSCALKGNIRTLGMFRGSDNPSWKGGATSDEQLIRSSRDMNIWRKKVFDRDDYRCFDCGQKEGKLHAHHIYAFSKYPRLRFAVENGLTLCASCHKKTDNYARKARLH